MKIVVVGGYGDIGSCVVEKLLEFSSHQLTIAGRNLRKARSVCNRFNDYVGALQLDLEAAPTLTSAFEKFDLVINCAGPFYKYGATVAKAAIETRTHYLDICDDPEPLPDLFALDEAARRAGVTAITGMGWNPGISSIAVRLGANQLDEVDEIKIARVVGSGDAKGLATLKHALHGITGEVPVVRDGKETTAPAWNDMEPVEFPAPLGEVPAFLFNHPEPVTIPKTIQAVNVSVRSGISPPWNNKILGFIRSLGLASTREKIDSVAGIVHKVQWLFSIGGVRRSALRIDIIGTKEKQERHLVFNMIDRIRPMTAIPCAIAALMLLEGGIARRGVMTPETCVDPVLFFDRLSDKGVRIMREGRL